MTTKTRGSFAEAKEAFDERYEEMLSALPPEIQSYLRACISDAFALGAKAQLEHQRNL